MSALAVARTRAKYRALYAVPEVARWQPRPEQVPPAGDWRVWLFMGGRGVGKTRTGAEWTIQSARAFPLVNIIGATTDDARDIMIEGESGIMACAPADFRPVYKPGLRRLDWPNGGRSLIFTADEPERLRGKQSMRLWCLTGDTGVLMADGSEKPICGVSVGDWVQTRRTARRVTAAWQSSPAAVVYRLVASDGRELVGTADHPVFVMGKGFVPLRSVRYGDILEVWEQTRNPVSSGAANAGGSTTVTTAIGADDRCIVPSTGPRTGQSRPVATCIISTTTRRTTPPATSKRSVARNISAVIARLAGVERTRACSASAPGSSGRSGSRTTLRARTAVRSLLRRARALGSAPAVARTRIAAAMLPSARWSPALVVASPISAISSSNGIARYPARSETSAVLTSPVSCAARYSAPVTPRRSVAPVSAEAPIVTVVRVERLPDRQAVYNLTVEGEHEYFANGILTHNCDEVAAWRRPDALDQAMFGLRLGTDPRAMLTTTPRPVKLIRDLLADTTGRVAVTRGSTYANRANLAPAFFEQIITKYEGTRLGRQELLGEYLDDTPGALWTRALIVKAERVPTMQRVVVAIDPAVTSGEDSDETGIVVAGLGVDGRGYVLADRSGRDTPDGWAKRAVAAYHEFSADRLVAEVNNGGDLVGQVIATVDPKVPFKKVTASRGKRTRAEPVAALYEQQKVFHKEPFEALEDQLVGWTPDSGDSPDRLDALVWALTELMVAPEPRRTMYTGRY